MFLNLMPKLKVIIFSLALAFIGISSLVVSPPTTHASFLSDVVEGIKNIFSSQD